MKKATAQLKEIIKSYGELKKLYLTKYELLSHIRDDMKKGEYDLNDIINFMYVFREISRLADDMRKEVDGIIRLFENMACAMYIAKYQNAPEDSKPIKASLATGTPKISMGVKLPKRDENPEQFVALAKHFGIPLDVLDIKLVSFHWPGVCQYLTELAAAGQPLPPGISADKTYPTYSVMVTTIQNLDEILIKIKGRRQSTVEKILTERPTNK